MPGYAKRTIDILASICGREKHLPDWEQLLQYLAELHVVRHILAYPWPEGTSFEAEPAAEGTRKNPEVAIHTSEFTLGVEVKAPALFRHQEQRTNNAIQLSARAVPKSMHASLPGIEKGITLPRDNPVKDFLASADQKFHGFNHQETFCGILVIVWDDFIYEPISALCHADCGLFTERSFAKDHQGTPLKFSAVDGVVIIRHLHQLVRACRDEPLTDLCRHPLDYGRPGEFPWKAFLPNPNGREVPDAVIECFQARVPSPDMGAEYFPNDIVWWS